MNVCMECGYEWEYDNDSCPMCRCGDVDLHLFNYGTISIGDIENNSHLIFVCMGDEKQVLVEREEE